MKATITILKQQGIKLNSLKGMTIEELTLIKGIGIARASKIVNHFENKELKEEFKKNRENAIARDELRRKYTSLFDKLIVKDNNRIKSLMKTVNLRMKRKIEKEYLLSESNLIPVHWEIPLDKRCESNTQKAVEKIIINKAKSVDFRSKLKKYIIDEVEYTVKATDAKDDAKQWKRGKSLRFLALKANWRMAREIENKTDLELLMDNAELVELAENNCTLNMGHWCEELQFHILTDVIIFDTKYNEKDEPEGEILAGRFVNKGVKFEEENFVPMLQSASKARSGSFLACPESKVQDYIRVINSGVVFEGKEKLGKLEARKTLFLSDGYTICVRDEKGMPTHYYKFTKKIYDKSIKTHMNAMVLETKQYQNSQGAYVIKEEDTVDENGNIDTQIEIINKEKLKEKFRNKEITLDEYMEKAKKLYQESNDGFGFVDIRVAVFWAYDLGEINKYQMTYFLRNFINMNKIKDDQNMINILNKIPTAFQVRIGYDKGLLIIWDLIAEGIFEDVIVTDGMHKRKEALKCNDWVRILNYNKKKSDKVKMSYQGLQALETPSEVLSEMANETVELLTEVLRDGDKAREYLGIYANPNVFDDKEHDENKPLAMELMEILEKDKNAIQHEYVFEKLLNLIIKAYERLGSGHILADGNYYYMITDPRLTIAAITGKKRNYLNPGTNYLNGIEDTVVTLRYPCASYLEPKALNLVNDEELWFLKDLLIFNHYDGAWIGMGGADHDGDIAKVLFDKRFLDNMNPVSRNRNIAVKIDTHDGGEKEYDTLENRRKFYIDTINGSDVGKVATMIAKYRSLLESNNEIDDNDFLQKCVISANAEGKVIDQAKTKENFLLPKYLETPDVAFSKPDWWVADRIIKGKMKNATRDMGYYYDHYDFKLKASKSKCQLGKYFRYVYEEYGILDSSFDYATFMKNEYSNVNTEAYISKMENHISVNKYNETYDFCKELHEEYSSKVKDIFTNETSDDVDTSKQYDILISNLSDKFRVVCRDKGFNLHTAAYCLLKVPVDIDKKKAGTKTEDGKIITPRKKSCAFKLAYEYVLDLIQAIGDNSTDIKIPDCLDGSEVTIDNGKMIINGVKYNTKLNNGKYIAFNNRRGSFIRVSNDALPCERVSTKKALEINNNNVVYAQSREYFKSVEKGLKNKHRDERIGKQGYFTICATYEYCLDNPILVLSHLASGNTFTVDKIEKDGKTMSVIKSMVNGKLEIIAGLMTIGSDMIGREFKIYEEDLKGIDFFAKKGMRRYSDGRIVREAISFVAYVADENLIDYTKAYESNIKLTMNYDVSEEDIEIDEVEKDYDYNNTYDGEVYDYNEEVYDYNDEQYSNFDDEPLYDEDDIAYNEDDYAGLLQ